MIQFLKIILNLKSLLKVIHFAGLKSISFSIYPLEYWDANVISTLSLLSVMKKYDCYNIIFSSSATVYKPNNSNLKETDPQHPLAYMGVQNYALKKF